MLSAVVSAAAHFDARAEARKSIGRVVLLSYD